MSHLRKLLGEPASGGSMESAAQSPVFASQDVTADNRFAGTLDSGDPAVHCALTVPECYEPSYAYPLIVWFHDHGADEQELLGILPHISDRNYAGLSLRGPLPIGNGLPHRRRWSLADRYLSLLEDELAVGLQQTSEHVNIHWDRVIVAGMGQGATMALRLLLRRPEWFAGAVCLGGEWTVGNRFEAWGQYARKALWLGHVGGWSAATHLAAIRHAGLLRVAGFDVTTHVSEFEDAGPATLGLAIDRWLLQSLCPDTVVM